MDLDNLGDAALVVAIGRYDQQALAEVYRRHGGAVWGLAKRVVRSDALADEVTQEVFLRLWNQPERFDAQKGELRTFLNAIAHNRAVDIVRSEASRSAREERTAREAPPAAYDLERQVWDLATAEHVRVALEALPERERSAIQLAYFEGYTYREIAELQDEPEGTVKSRIRIGMKRMRKALHHLRYDPIGDSL